MIAKNVSALMGSLLLTKAINLLVSIMTVRWLGTQELGRYAYIIAFSFPFGALADFGLATLAIREISREPARIASVVATLSRALLGLSGLSLSVMMLVALGMHHDPMTFFGIAVVGFSSLVSALTTPCLVVLTAREQFNALSLYRTVASGLAAAATLAALYVARSAVGLLIAGAGASLFALACARALARAPRSVAPVRLAAIGEMLRQAVPFGLLMMAYALYYRIDTVMLKWYAGEHEVGLYAAAYRFLDTIALIAATVGGPFFPRLSSLIHTHRDLARDLVQSAWRPLLAIGLPISIGTVLVAPELVIFLFGQPFADAAPILRVLICAALPLFWVNIASHALNAADCVWGLVGVYGVGAAINIGGNLLLIPLWGALGASLATLVCEWLTLGLVVRLLDSALGLSLTGEGLWRYAAATAALAVAVWSTRMFGLGTEITAGSLAYVGALWITGYTRSPDAVSIKRLLTQ